MSTPAPASTAPLDYPDKIDGAVLKVAAVVVLGAIMSILDITVVNVALPTFQSVFGSEEWLRPYTVEHVADLAQQGLTDIAVISPAFATDCIETLEEIQGEIQDAFKAAGGQQFAYIPCLNDDAAHIAMLTDLVAENLAGWL